MKIIDEGNRVGFQIEEEDGPEVYEFLEALIEASKNDDKEAYLAILSEMDQSEAFKDVARRVLAALKPAVH